MGLLKQHLRPTENSPTLHHDLPLLDILFYLAFKQTTKNKKMTSELVLVNPQEYGLDEQKATELTANLPQIKQEREALVPLYDEILKLDIEAPETAKKAKEIRLKIRDNRTKGIEVWHKNAKDYFLKGGQFVDAIKRQEVAINQRMEENLEAIEKHFENLEKARIAALNETRKAALSLFVESVENLDLGNMADDVWEAYYTTKANAYHERIAAEKAAEEKRIAQEAEEKRQNDWRMKFAPYQQFISDNLVFCVADNLLEEALNNAIAAKAEYEAEQQRIREENERLRKQQEEAEAEAKKAREAAEAEQRKIREESEAKQRELESEVQKARDEAARIQAEKDAMERKQREESEKAEKARIAAEKKAARAPDKEKLQSVKETLLSLQFPEMATDEGKQVLNAVQVLLSKVNAYIDEKVSLM